MIHSSFARIFSIFLFATLLILFTTAHAVWAEDPPRHLQDDLTSILAQAKWSGPKISLAQGQNLKPGEFQIRCTPREVRLVANSSEGWTTALFELGIYLPHPLWATVSHVPWQKKCGRVGRFVGKTPLRGFHLHLQHPSEWVSQFLSGDIEGARQFLRWLTWNQQNLLQIQLLRGNLVQFSELDIILREAQSRGIRISVSVSFVLAQQKSYNLIPFWSQLFLTFSKRKLLESLEALSQKIPFDYLVVELGTTEFTPSPWKNTQQWIETARMWLESRGKHLLTKVHVSTKLWDEKLGNFNFLAQYAHPSVGMLPHTVHFYGLRDSSIKMYERDNFQDLEELLVTQTKIRPVWYYPETSYYVGLDIDIPLLLTDYLQSRADDWNIVEQNQIAGHITFSTGQEFGYWLNDWTVALLARKGQTDPAIALQLLGEDPKVWNAIFAFQHQHIKQNRLIALISASNLMDEIPSLYSIMDRTLLRDLRKNPTVLRHEIALLQAAVLALPSLNEVRSEELKGLLQITWLRIQHAHQLRLFLESNREVELDKAVELRKQAATIIQAHNNKFARWPNTLAYQKKKNPTSYPEGYAYTATNLHFWKREEEIVRHNKWNPFFMNIYNPLKLLF